MFVLRNKKTKLYVRRNSNYTYTDNLREARLFSRTSDYKQSNAWLGSSQDSDGKWSYHFTPYTNETRPVEPVRVELAIVTNPNLKDVEITIS